MRSAMMLIVLTASALLPGCVSLTIENVEFGWPVESVLTVTPENRIEEKRYALAFSVSGLAEKEFEDSTALKGQPVRLLRSSEGFYFLTAAKFKHVYVFSWSAGELNLKSAIEVNETGLRNPALNQRTPYVELVDGPEFKKLLTKNDVVEETQK